MRARRERLPQEVAMLGESHGSLNKGLGEADDFATAEVDKFLATMP